MNDGLNDAFGVMLSLALLGGMIYGLYSLGVLIIESM